MLHTRGVHMEAKPFSIGVRIEHPQAWVDQARYGKYAKHPVLGAAAYSLAHHCANGRTVYSFCMCPGGRVVAAASEEGGVVTNGMSQYSRNERNANAGIVVSIDPRDYPGGPLAGIALQRELEYLRSDAYISAEARRLANLGVPGEQVLIIPPGAEAPLPEALAAFTINAAYTNRDEANTGSLEVGKRANLAVLDRNLFDTPPTEISDTQVLVTLFEGKAVHGYLGDL